MAYVRKAIVGLAGGLLFGFIILGIGGRFLMRLIILFAQQQPGFSAGGTLEVLAFASLIGLPSGLAFVAVRQYLPGKSLLQGALFGALVFAAVLLTPGEAKRAALAFPELLPVTLALFAALFIVYGITLAMAMERFISRLERADTPTLRDN